MTTTRMTPSVPEVNPYGFVRMDWTRTPDGNRKPPPPRDRYAGHDGTPVFSGRLQCQLTTETSLFIPHSGAENAGSGPAQDPQDKREYFRYPAVDGPPTATGPRRVLVPASTLKGLLRNLVETLAPGCWRLYAPPLARVPTAGAAAGGAPAPPEEQPIELPAPFRACTKPEALCAACRMFGTTAPQHDDPGETDWALAGAVEIDDALCVSPTFDPPLYLKLLMGPHPDTREWYHDATYRPTGRKFYRHLANEHVRKVAEATGRIRTTGTLRNRYVWPLAAGHTFDFTVRFMNLDEDDLALLVYALCLEPGLRHKIGLAKPLGFGSVHSTLKSAIDQDMTQRYRGGGGTTLRTGDSLALWVDGHVLRATAAIAQCTLDDLRDIWKWPSEVRLGYPPGGWLRRHPRVQAYEARSDRWTDWY